MTFKIHDGVEIDGKSLTNSGGTLTWGGVSVGSSGGVTISSNANNRVLTGDGSNAVAETKLTFDGTNLQIVAGDATRGLISEKWYLGATDTSFIERDSTVNIGYRADGIHRFWTYNSSWLERAQIIDTGFNLLAGHSYQLGGTTVIDSSRNLTNIGTISSGTITSTGIITSAQHFKATGSNMKLHAGGNHIINIDLNGNFYPQTHNAVDLGFSDSLAFRNLHLVGAITGGATINSGTVTADVSGATDHYYFQGKESGTTRYSVYENSNNVYINTWGGLYLRANQHGGSGGGLGASGAVFNAANGLSLGTYGSTNGGESNGRLQLYGSTANKQADLYCSNGNLHIDADNGNGIYLNWYGSQSATSTAGTYFGNANAGQVARIDGSGNFTLSGTVDGRDVAADGTKLDGIAAGANNYSFPYTVSDAASNNTVVQRTGSGYIMGNYINMTANDVSSGVTKVMVETGNDNYMRHGTAAAVRTFINVADGANNYVLPTALTATTFAASGNVIIGGNFTNNSYSTVSSTRLGFGGGNDLNNYYIGTNLENFGGNYTKLDLRWHTGIRMGAQGVYGGIRFYDSEDLGSKLMSIGEGSGVTSVKVYNNLVVDGTVDGRDVAADGTKLDGIAAGANNYSLPATVVIGNSTTAQPASDLVTFNSYNNGNSTSGDQSSIQIYNASANQDAFVAFHVSSDYAGYFGLDGTTNDLFWGGWSVGNNKHKIFHAGNSTQFTSALNTKLAGIATSANNYSFPYAVDSGNTASAIVQRNSSGDFTARYIFATHFNQSSSNSENPTIGAFWTNSTSDGYNRKSTPAHVGSSIKAHIPCVRTDTGSTIGNNHSVVQKGQFTTGTSGQNNSQQAAELSYHWGYQFGGGWTSPFPDLILGYHTGMRLGGYTGYGGTRFYSDHPSRTTTILFSVGNGDSHVRATNNIYAYTSDRRLKENFRPIENAVDKVKAIGGFIFDWRKDMMEKHDFVPDQEKNDAGLIAQEVQKVMPAAIKRAPFDHDLTKPNQSKSGEDFLTVQYEKMVPLLVEAIKEQQKQIDELKQKLETK